MTPDLSIHRQRLARFQSDVWRLKERLRQAGIGNAPPSVIDSLQLSLDRAEKRVSVEQEAVSRLEPSGVL